MNKKILTIVGARPQFIKVGPVSLSLKGLQGVEEVIVHTGQHFDSNMSDNFFSELSLPRPKYNLGIGSSSHGIQTGAMLTALDPIMLDESPDLVLVYGDTNSTLAGALTASKLHFPVAHVEAGLRSFNKRMPEEINRILTDHVSTLLFTPSERAADNLVREGVARGAIHTVGDVMLDAVLMHQDTHQDKKNSLKNRLGLPESYYLLTLHRAENTDDSDRLCRLMSELLAVSAEKPIVFPMHPRTRLRLTQLDLITEVEQKLKVLGPVGYGDSLTLIDQSELVLTDSGGMQKEAYFLKTPCITLREETEWGELLDIGVNVLYRQGSDSLPNLIEHQRLLTFDEQCSLFGDGKAASKITTLIYQQLTS